MKVTCKYSGIEFNVDNFANMRMVHVHPLFYCAPKQLLSRAGDWAAQKLNEKERRLLFLSLLYTTELVEFRVTATPADSIVQSNMESLIKFIGWQSGISSPQLALPRFVVSPETRTLANAKYWLETWWQARKDFEDGYRAFSDLAKLRNREVALERLIKNHQKKTEDYSGILAAWAMDASNVPVSLREYWISLFKLKGLNIYQAKTVDLEEIVEHMTEYLDHGSIYAAATLRHMRVMLAKNKTGLNFGLGIPDEELEKLDFEVALSTPFRIVEDEVETYNKQVVAADAPEDEPSQRDYPSRLTYLKAKAAWILARKARQYYLEQHPQETATAGSTVPNIDNEEDDSAEEPERSEVVHGSDVNDENDLITQEDIELSNEGDVESCQDVADTEETEAETGKEQE